LANNLLSEADLQKPEPKFSLCLAVCPACHLVQITETIPSVDLFGEYLYFSSFSDAMLKHAATAVADYIGDYDLSNDSFVTEIASNDGYLLKNFVAANVPCLGIEPAKNIAAVAEEAGVPTLCEFFGVKTAEDVVAVHGKADLILGNNVFAHAPDINDFIGGIAILLKDEGRAALEFPYLGDFIANLEFDTTYHEHIFYFSVLALKPAFERHGLEIYHVMHLPIHGGSLRLFVGKNGAHPVSTAPAKLIEEERSAGLDGFAAYEAFAGRIRELKEKLVNLIAATKAEGHSIAAYGASAKGSTLLNYFGIGSESLNFIVDRSTYKQGKFTPGTHLEILPAEELLSRNPEYTLLLTWNFAEEILSQQSVYRKAGGKFIIPLPEPRIV
jgi:SAM-dependent methyltransferase